SVAISPDGRLIASGFLYEGIKVWEVDSGVLLRALRGHTASVNSISFSPTANGSRQAAAIARLNSGTFTPAPSFAHWTCTRPRFDQSYSAPTVCGSLPAALIQQSGCGG